jgi:hypothetical protein
VEVGRVEVDVGELDVIQRPRAERTDRLVELLADPGDLGLAVPESAPSATTRSSTLRVEMPCT